MKKENFSLQIQTPCSEDWNAMQLRQDGKFCGSCSKVVVDFTVMSSEAIADFFKIHAGKKVCGNFYREQLQENYSITYDNPYSFNKTLIKYSLAGVLIFSGVRAGAQTVSKQVEVVKDNSGNKIQKGTSASQQKGNSAKLNLRVTDASGKLLGGTRVVIFGVNEKHTSPDGNYSINVADSLAQKKIQVTIFAPGYASVTRFVELSKQGSDVLIVAMEEREMLKGEVEYIPENKKKCGNK